MILRTTSHRSREKLHRALGHKPQYYYTFEYGGCFVKLYCPLEIAKALAITGITKCRDQNEDTYMKCWSTQSAPLPQTTGANHRSPFGIGA